MNIVDVEELRHIAEIEFNDIVVEASVRDVNELRTESHLSAIPEEALREFLTFARTILEN